MGIWFDEVMEMRKQGKKLGKKKQRYYNDQMRIERAHEMKMKLIDWMATDPEAKYFVGFVGGAAVGGVLGIILKDLEDAGFVPSSAPADQSFAEEVGDFYWLVQSQAFTPTFAKTLTEKMVFGGAFESEIKGILGMAGSGIPGGCFMILILKSIFSGTDLGELLPDGLI